MRAVPGESSDPGRSARRPLLVLHLMKTGGFSLLYQVMANARHRATWGIPAAGEDELTGIWRYSSVERLRALDADARNRLDIVIGHLPFATAEVAGFDRATIATVVRDPVDRVISYLNMCRAENAEHRGKPLEAIYEDPYLRPRMICNHQTKMLGMTAEQATAPPPVASTPFDEAVVAALREQGYFETPQFFEDANRAGQARELIDTPLVWPVEVDGTTLASALANLERIGVLGIHEEFDVFLRRLGALMAWTIDQDIRVNRGAPVVVSDSFRRRIEEDNTLDRELYERARELHRDVHRRARALDLRAVEDGRGRDLQADDPAGAAIDR